MSNTKLTKTDDICLSSYARSFQFELNLVFIGISAFHSLQHKIKQREAFHVLIYLHLIHNNLHAKAMLSN